MSISHFVVIALQTSIAEDAELSAEVELLVLPTDMTAPLTDTELPDTTSTLLDSSAADVFLSQTALVEDNKLPYTKDTAIYTAPHKTSLKSSQKGKNARPRNAPNMESTPALPALQSNLPLAPLADDELNNTATEDQENFPASANTVRVRKCTNTFYCYILKI